jgi:hypothetical protein
LRIHQPSAEDPGISSRDPGVLRIGFRSSAEDSKVASRGSTCRQHRESEDRKFPAEDTGVFNKESGVFSTLGLENLAEDLRSQAECFLKT